MYNLLPITPFSRDDFLVDLPTGFRDLFTLHFNGSWPATVTEVVDKARERAAALGPSETIIYGHSTNAALALAAATVPCRAVIAVAAPRRIPLDRTMLVSHWEAHAEPERKERAAVLAAEYEAAPESQKRAIWERYNNLRSCYDINAEPANLDRLTAPVMEWVGSVMASGESIDWQATLDSIAVPVLLVLGAYDFNTPAAPWLAEPARPGWTIEVFQQSAHSPPTEEPDLFVSTVERWLSALRR